MSEAPTQEPAHRRPHTAPMASPFLEFDLTVEVDRLHRETTWDTGQNARTLMKYEDKVREMHSIVEPKVLSYVKDGLGRLVDWKALQEWSPPRGTKQTRRPER